MSSDAKGEKKARRKRTPRSIEASGPFACQHGVRLDVYSILFERIASPSELAWILEKPLSTISYHIDELKLDGLIELVKTEPRRGAVEHYYQATTIPELSFEELQALPKLMRRKVIATALRAIMAESLASLRHGGMDQDDDLNVIWIPTRFSQKGNSEMNALQVETFERFLAIKARDEDREKNDSAPVKIAAMLWFQRARPERMPASNATKLSTVEATAGWPKDKVEPEK